MSTTTAASAEPVRVARTRAGPRATIAVLVPCFNEAPSIADVVTAFTRALPEATVYVYDNNSSDDTAAVAAQAGALVRREPRQGKGNVLRRMFADVEADVYVMVDGDDTYDARSARPMVDMLLSENLGMVVGARKPVDGPEEVFRRGHTFGNRIFNRTGHVLFGPGFTDIFSGYRVMSRRFVKSFPLISGGFEVETELTVHAVEIAAPCAEIETPYGCRREESSSKLRTFSDGFRILRMAISLFKDLRPLRFFGILFGLFTAFALALGIPVVTEYAATRLVLRFPTAILAAALQTLGFIFLTAGIVLDSVSRARREARLLAYLAIPAPPGST